MVFTQPPNGMSTGSIKIMFLESELNGGVQAKSGDNPFPYTMSSGVLCITISSAHPEEGSTLPCTYSPGPTQELLQFDAVFDLCE
jgi:hypothetical protein